jgi:hypothetical protein
MRPSRPIHSYADADQYQRGDSKRALEGFEQALLTAQLLLEGDPAVLLGEAAMNTSRNKRPSSSLSFIIPVIKAGLRPAGPAELVHNLKGATHEVWICQRRIDSAFKLLWNLYAIARQDTGFSNPIDGVQMGPAFDLFLQRFDAHPFAVAPEEANSKIFAHLNHTHDAANRYEELARHIGRAWVNDRIQDDTGIRDFVAVQASLFELLWNETAEQLTRQSIYSTVDPERMNFESELAELKNGLQEAVVRSRKERFTIAFCGMVKSGKSLFLNALIGRTILPSDGKWKSVHSHYC